MGFFNNPENNSIKVILIVAVLAIAGYFVYQNMNSGNEGRVLRMQTAQPTETAPASSTTRMMSDSAKVGNITLNQGQPSPAKAVCKPGDYQGANGGCFHVKADCTYTYEDKACPTDLNAARTGTSSNQVQ